MTAPSTNAMMNVIRMLPILISSIRLLREVQIPCYSHHNEPFHFCLALYAFEPSASQTSGQPHVRTDESVASRLPAVQCIDSISRIVWWSAEVVGSLDSALVL